MEAISDQKQINGLLKKFRQLKLAEQIASDKFGAEFRVNSTVCRASASERIKASVPTR